jgi:hypothetical protein
VIEVPVHTAVAEAEILTVGTTDGKITIDNTFEVSVFGLIQAPVAVKIHFTSAPLVKVFDVNDAPVAVFTPFTCHWYEGEVPPFVGVAVNTTDVPVQTLFALVAMVTSGAEAGFTVIVTGVAVAVGTVGQDAEDVITTVITSPLFNVEEE